MNRSILAPAGAALSLLLLGAIGLAAPDARARAERILEALARRPEAQRVASEPLEKGKAALSRATRVRASGDQLRGAMLEETALEWASSAELLDRTATVERELFELQRATNELETKTFRAQALVEQTIARRARAEEALRKLGDKVPAP